MGVDGGRQAGVLGKSVGRGQDGYHRPALEVPAELLLTRAEQEALIAKWTPYAWSIGRKFHVHASRWLERDECEAIAVEGLWEGARRFQPSKGVQFPAYATHWVKQCLQKAKRKAMGVPSHHKYGTEEFAASIRVCSPAASLNVEYGSNHGNSGTLADAVAARPEEDRPEFPADFWYRVMKFLDPVKRQVIRLRFHDGLLLEEVGMVMGITRERVRQLESWALEKIRQHVDFGDCVEDL